MSQSLPKAVFPVPLYQGENLSHIGRATASSMQMLDIQNPGQEAFRATDGKVSTQWVARDNNQQWLEIEWMKPQSFNSVIVKEKGNNITAHKIQYLKNGQWLDVASASSCGVNKAHAFKPVSSTRCRLYIEQAKDRPVVTEFEIYLRK